MNARPKPRHPRIERTRSPGLTGSAMAGGDENAFLWAVSYADLLTVLLCFFILFFSSNPEKRESLIHQILITQMQVTGISAGISKPSGGAATQNTAGSIKSVPITDLHEVLKDLNVTSVQDGERVVLLFPDNIYARGSADLPPESVAVLKDLLARLKPYLNDLDFVFVGHTDPTPVTQTHGRWIEDNFDLSSARANKALKQAEHLGFPSDHLRTEGDGSFQRASRTLSITIQGRQKGSL